MDEDLTIQARFEKFHTENGNVYKEFVKRAHQARSFGLKRYGAKSIIELIRWDKMVQTNGKPFKINNVYTSRYVRMFLQEYPSFQGFFRLRQLKKA